MKIAKLLIPCLLGLALATPAKADNGLALAYMFGYGGGFYNMGVPTYNNMQMPYFSLHPPVYYGQRFTRPYGASPFAAWPQLQGNAAYTPRPHVEREPTTIDNPYCCQPGGEVVAAPSVVHISPAQPLVIDNPYFVRERVLVSAK